MTLTYTFKEAHSSGDQWKKQFDMALDSSYPATAGGYYLDPRAFGLTQIEDCEIEDNRLFFNYVKSTGRFKVYAGGGSSHSHGIGTIAATNESTHAHAVGTLALTTPALTGSSSAGSAHQHNFGVNTQKKLIVSEQKAVAGDQCDLQSNPAYIISVEVTAGGVTGPFNMVPAGATVATREFKVTGGKTVNFAAADAVTGCRVTYFPVINGTMFDTGMNWITDENVIANGAGVNLANRACLVQYIYDITTGTLLTPTPPGEAPGANEFALDINNGGNSTITTNAGRNGNNLAVTYCKFTALPSVDMFVDDTDVTLVAQAYNFCGDGNYSNMVIPGLGTMLVGESGAGANELASWVGPSGTAANGVARWQPSLNSILTAQTAPMLTTAISWVVVPFWALSGEMTGGNTGTENAHTHAVGTLAITDAALTGSSAAGAPHTHAMSGTSSAAGGASGAVEFSNGDNLSTYTGINVVVYGR